MKKEKERRRAPKKSMRERMDLVAEFLACTEDAKEFISPGIIGVSVLGAPEFQGSAYASGPCKALVEAGVAERNTRGQYRLVSSERAKIRRRLLYK